jgi:tetratricopeptide (TPR) repeat protein
MNFLMRNGQRNAMARQQQHADDAERHNRRGISLARQGQPEAAVDAFKVAIACRPGYAKAYINLGIVFAQHARLPEAIAAFKAAIARNPALAEAHINLGKALALLDQHDEAIACFQRAVRLRPDDADTCNMLGVALTEQGRLPDAIAAYEGALRARPGYAAAYNNLSIAHRYAGNIGAAVAACEQALASAPTGAAYLNLVNLRRVTPADPHLAGMERLAASTIPPESRIPLHFALGKAYDDCQEPERAFPHLRAGNRLMREVAAYDEAATLGTMERTRHVLDAGLIRSLRSRGERSAAPIFILGMPRSGSTLLEQMLAEHPLVVALGERTDFGRLTDSLCSGAYPDAVRHLSPETLKALGGRYLEAVSGRAPKGSRMIDKMPGNFLYAGLIHLALPNARIIHIRRSPADTCFSCFLKLFRSGHAFTYDLAELGRYYRAYEKLMDHWRRAIPASCLIDLDYESLVDDPATQIARILDHCGLVWSEACLSVGRTERAVLTASATQVRETLYRGSIGRWRGYNAFLLPLLQELEKGLAVADDF